VARRRPFGRNHTKGSVREPLPTYVAGPGRGGPWHRGVPVSASSPSLCPANSPSHLPGQALARALDDSLGQASAATPLCPGIFAHARRGPARGLPNTSTILSSDSPCSITCTVHLGSGASDFTEARAQSLPQRSQERTFGRARPLRRLCHEETLLLLVRT